MDFFQSQEDARRRTRLLVVLFAASVLVSGVVCFVLEENWEQNIAGSLRYPLYGCLGTSLCFAVVFASIDLMTRMQQFLFVWRGQTIIQSVGNLRLLALFAVVIGLMFGAIFAYVDSPVKTRRIEMAIRIESLWCYPAAGLLGALFSVVHEYFRLKNDLVNLQEGGSEVKMADEQDDDIFLEEDTGL